MTEHRTSRRAVLGALATIPAVVALPALAQAPADRSAWDRAFAIYEQAQAASDADDVTFVPLFDRCEAECEAVPHFTTPKHNNLGPGAYTTADWRDVAEARRSLAASYDREVKPHYEAHLTACRELVEAADNRDAEIARIRERHGYNAACGRAEALGQAAHDARWALFETPAPDCEAFRWKLEILFGPGTRDEDDGGAAWSAPVINTLMADARRLLTA